MKFKYIVPLLLVCACLACTNDKEPKQDVYFGGLIVNPTSKFVVLLKKDVVVDTFFLDSKNQFGGKLVNAEKGLYVFKHPPENQITYLEPGDSTLVLVNTLDFDESINFSGKGASKSNYLNNMYLLNQKNNDFILNYHKLPPSVFAHKTDSIRESRIQQLNKLNKKHKFSDEFYSLANASINYEYYDLRERYAYLLRKYSREKLKGMPADFHEYRKEISFNDEHLEDYYVYLNLIDDFLRTKALEYCETDETESQECYELTDQENITRRIKLADSLIQNERVKNTFVERLAAQGIIYSQSTEEIIDFLKLLQQLEYSGQRFEDLRQMGGIQNALLPGNNLGAMRLLNTKRDTVEFKNVSTKPKITYHWSLQSQSHHQWQTSYIQKLRKKYPEVDFIGVNIDKNHTDEWIDAVKRKPSGRRFEYKLGAISVNETLLKNYLNKMIFLDSNENIVRGDVQLNALNLDEQIEKFLDDLYL